MESEMSSPLQTHEITDLNSRYGEDLYIMVNSVHRPYRIRERNRGHLNTNKVIKGSVHEHIIRNEIWDVFYLPEPQNKEKI